MPPISPLNKTLIALALSQMSMVSNAADINVGISCSLASAIKSANQELSIGGCTAGAGPDNTIILPSNTTITLTSVDLDGEIAGDSGLPLITSNITIQGNGSTVERSSAPGTPAFRIMAMEPEQVTGISLSLNSLTLSNGLADGGAQPYGAGGAIYMGIDNTLILDHVVLSNNVATGDTYKGQGGAIFAYASDYISISNSQISGNSAGYGGGIYLEESNQLHLNNTSISNNLADNGTYLGGGGGIYAYLDTEVEIINSSLSNNTAGYGGGILTYNPINIEISNSSLSGNSASYKGGAFFGNFTASPSQALTISQSLISGNKGDTSGNGYPGGAFAFYRGDDLSITNSTISGNMAHGAAAIYLNAAQIELVNTTVSDNVNTTSYGSLHVVGNASYPPTVTLENTVLANSTNPSTPVECSSNYSLVVNATASWVESFDAGLSCFNGGPVPATITQGDPKLTSLQSFGSTKVHRANFDSGLLGAADTAICAAAPVNGLDQVGATRGVASCTIGAAELPGSDDNFFVIPIGSNKTITFSL